jgi:hypothetical protein
MLAPGGRAGAFSPLSRAPDPRGMGSLEPNLAKSRHTPRPADHPDPASQQTHLSNKAIATALLAARP